jgi:ABC-type multidrug transport system fused ATPase/permease subunit
LVQTGVALKRIVVYLDEEEVSSQVSSLKKSASDSQTDEDSGLGIENGTFKWNEVVDAKEDKDKTNSPTTTEETTITVEGPDESPLENDHKFELKDISVMFPEGELTVIAGPTASGKTALLVRSFSITGPSY